jgi:hypothetical protein
LYVIFGIGILASALLTAQIVWIITSMAALLHVAALTLPDQPMVYCNAKEEEKIIALASMLFTVSSTISTTGGDFRAIQKANVDIVEKHLRPDHDTLKPRLSSLIFCNLRTKRIVDRIRIATMVGMV